MIKLKNVTNDMLLEIDLIVKKITNTIPVSKILLFGSYAYGSPDVDSDIDLCIITDDKRRKIEIIWDIQESAYQFATHPIDILVYKPEEFLYRSESVSTIEKTISSKGVVIYG